MLAVRSICDMRKYFCRGLEDHYHAYSEFSHCLLILFIHSSTHHYQDEHQDDTAQDLLRSAPLQLSLCLLKAYMTVLLRLSTAPVTN